MPLFGEVSWTTQTSQGWSYQLDTSSFLLLSIILESDILSLLKMIGKVYRYIVD